jgi:hypothetical protein
LILAEKAYGSRELNKLLEIGKYFSPCLFPINTKTRQTTFERSSLFVWVIYPLQNAYSMSWFRHLCTDTLLEQCKPLAQYLSYKVISMPL